MTLAKLSFIPSSQRAMLDQEVRTGICTELAKGRGRWGHKIQEFSSVQKI